MLSLLACFPNACAQTNSIYCHFFLLLQVGNRLPVKGQYPLGPDGIPLRSHDPSGGDDDANPLATAVTGLGNAMASGLGQFANAHLLAARFNVPASVSLKITGTDKSGQVSKATFRSVPIDDTKMEEVMRTVESDPGSEVFCFDPEQVDMWEKKEAIMMFCVGGGAEYTESAFSCMTVRQLCESTTERPVLIEVKMDRVVQSQSRVSFFGR